MSGPLPGGADGRTGATIAYFPPGCYAGRGQLFLLDGRSPAWTARRTGSLRGGKPAHDRLLLTVGGRARHLPSPAAGKALYLRTIEDARRSCGLHGVARGASGRASSG
jgi:hypothetical protein